MPKGACPKAGAKEGGAAKEAGLPKLGGEEKAPVPNAVEPKAAAGDDAANGDAPGAIGGGTALLEVLDGAAFCASPASSCARIS